MNLIPNDLMYDTLIDLTFDLVMATLLAPGINVHLFPFIKSSKDDELKRSKSGECLNEKANLSDCDKQVLKSDELNECTMMGNGEPNRETTNNVESERETNDESTGEHNLDKASKLFGQFLASTKSYLNLMFDDKVTEPTEEFIKQKEVELNKAHEFLTDVVLNQDPTYPVDNNELNKSFKFIEDEFDKLNKLKESVKLNPKSNSIESNLVTSYFENDSSPNASSDGEDDFEIIN